MGDGQGHQAQVKAITVTRSAAFQRAFAKLESSIKKNIEAKLRKVEQRAFTRGMNFDKFCPRHARIYINMKDRLTFNLLKDDHYEADLLFVDDYKAYQIWCKRHCR